MVSLPPTARHTFFGRRLDSYGSLWIPMVARRTFLEVTWSPSDSRWIPMASDGFSSPHCVPHFLWRPFGFLGLPMDSYGFFPPPLLAATALLSVAAWILMAPYGFVWLLFPQLGLERPQVPKTAHKS